MLVASGHVRQPSSRVKPRKEAPSQPMKFRSCDGIEMEVGKNALQNERLTMGARGNETRLHAQKMPGSHVLIHTEGDVPESTLMQAAMLAAYYSKGVRSTRCRLTRRCAGISKTGRNPAGFVYLHPPENAVYHPERSGNQEKLSFCANRVFGKERALLPMRTIRSNALAAEY